MTSSRDRRLAAGLLLLLILLTAAAAIQQTQSDDPPPYTVNSSAPDGARALSLWLSELGYDTIADPPPSFLVPPDATVTLLLEPSLNVSFQEWELLDRWIEEGGTLIIAGSGFASALTFSHFDYRLVPLPSSSAPAVAQAPVLLSPPLTESAGIRPRAAFTSDAADATPILTVDGKPVLVALRRGTGQVLLSSSAYPFSNAGLKEPGNGALVLNLISSASRGGSIWFDEWHHGLRADQFSVTGPANWLRYTPAGRAIAFSGAAIFAAIALRGRHFGRPEPMRRPDLRKGPLEHITAIANLSRRARHRSAVLQQYRLELKRSLGHPLGLNPKLPDDEYVQLLTQMLPGVDAKELSALLRELQEADVSERKMIELAAAASRWMR